MSLVGFVRRRERRLVDKGGCALSSQIGLEKDLLELIKRLIVPRLTEKGFYARGEGGARLGEGTSYFFIAAFEEFEHREGIK